MFRGPLLHLGAGLFARQLALEHLGADGLALGAELLGEGPLLRRGVGTKPGTESGTLAGGEASATAGHEASSTTGTKSSALAGGEALVRTGTDTGASAGAEALTRTGGNAAALTHAASPLRGEPAHLLLVLNTLCLAPSKVVDAGECPGLQATLRESWNCDRGQCHGQTKELDGAHLRLPMNVGDWTAPFAEWTLGVWSC